MDEATLDSLLRALEASPDNAALIATVLRARLARNEAPLGLPLVEGRAPSFFAGEADRVLAARVCRLAGDAARAQAFVREATSAEALLELARACADRNDLTEGAQAYRRALERNAALDDPELASRLAAREVGPKNDDGRPRLRVIANDDTARTEAARILRPEGRRVTFADVGGLDDVKAQITKRIILPFRKPSLFQAFKKKVGGGILLYGPPGCGKTLLARATAGECNAKFFNVALSDVLDMYIGESERKLHAIFEEARRVTPSVLFFDEIEALAGKRQYTREATSSKVVSALLSELDGFAQNNKGVLILGATNVPWALDPAARRPGRFDRVLFVPPPDRAARESIANILLSGRPVKDADPAWLAERTSGFSGADLENVIETAADHAIEASMEDETVRPIVLDHVKAALKEVKPTTLEWLTTARNYARYANESGLYDEVLTFLDRHAER
jgi:SpoVK/Ycf46/Vps4 family AAA+-type ATPase